MEAGPTRIGIAVPVPDLIGSIVRAIKLTPQQLGAIARRDCRTCYGTGSAGRINGKLLPCVCVRKIITRMVGAEVEKKLAPGGGGQVIPGGGKGKT